MKDQPLPMIGNRIRAQRQKLHMSLGELAERTNLSKSFLSQVERGLTNPSIESLGLIAEALEVPMFLFFVEDDTEKVVVRRGERRKIGVFDSRFQYESIWFGASRKMEILIGYLKPGESSTDQPRSHSVSSFLTAVDECFIVLQGKVEFQLGEESYVLEEGDSAYFNGAMPHQYRALGEEELGLLFAIAPPAISR
ncbi:MAG: helix-turn-helix transcriptional regulator [Chloroflexi bacterium]|nr:helix-turn-helix transcriptional regulator [Chloroflexota bacterium]